MGFRTPRESPYSQGLFFGTSLQQLLLDSLGQKNNPKKLVPEWIMASSNYLMNEVRNKDTWILSLRNRSDVKKFMEQLHKSNNDTKFDFKNFTPATIFNVLKTFLGKLPTPLMTFELHELFTSASFPELLEKEEHLNFTRKIVSCLPDIERDTLAQIIETSHAILSSNVGDENKELFLKGLGPVILMRKGVQESKKEDDGDSVALMRYMSDNFEDLFLNNPELSKKAPPVWLIKINENKLQLLDASIAKLARVVDYLKKYNDTLYMKMSTEFKANVALCDLKLSIAKEYLNPSKLTKLVYSYHLERFNYYLASLYDTLYQAGINKRLDRLIESPHLYGTVQKLLLSMQYELDIFMFYFDRIVGFPSRTDTQKRDIFLKCTLASLPDLATKEVWRDFVGIDKFMAPRQRFIDAYLSALNLPADFFSLELIAKLFMVLDVHNTGFITVFSFGDFMRAFGPFKQSAQKARETLQAEWFYGYVSRKETSRLLESTQCGTFLVRFSTSPGDFAIDFKDERGSISSIKVETDREQNGYCIREGNELKLYPSLAALIKVFDNALQYPYTESLVQEPWFFGDLSSDECQFFLSDEPSGSYLIRFSSQVNNLTLSVLFDNVIQHHRLERLLDGRVYFPNKKREYDSILVFLKENEDLCIHPFFNDNTISHTQREDEEKKMRYVPAALIMEEYMEYLESVKKGQNDGTRPRGLSDAEQLLSRSFTEQLNHHEQRSMFDYLFKLPAEEQDRVIKKVRKLTGGLSNSGDKRKTVKKTTLLKISPTVLEKKEAELNKVHLLSITVNNPLRCGVTFSVRQKQHIARRYFFGISPAAGQIEKGKSITITIAVVLYQPIMARIVVPVYFESEDKEYKEYIHFAIRVSCSKAALLREIDPPPFWVVSRSEVDIKERLGGGASASVFAASLYGADVAFKNWDLGKKDPTPRDCLAELEVFRAYQHDNLLPFVGGITEVGNAYIITELAVNGSLDGYLQRQRSLTMLDKIQIAADIARGMAFLHENNRLHRDLKSLNILIDAQKSAKVADFGESRTAADTMTMGTGTNNWMAPEVYSSMNYTAKADVFSFGIILWELLTNQLPNRTYKDVAEGVVPVIDQLTEEALPEYCALIKMCCRKNPNKRPSFPTLVRKLKIIKEKFLVK
jgi:hypothetical protein